MVLDDLIAQLGGNRFVATTLGCERSAIALWKKRGIPPLRAIQLSELAKRKDIIVNPAELLLFNRGKGRR